MKNQTLPWRVLGALVLLLAAGAAKAAETDFDTLVAQRVRAFFAGQLGPADFSLAAPWRATFARQGGRAPLVVEQVDITEVRLPDNPGGLEGLFAVKVALRKSAYVTDKPLPPGAYWLPGSMRFVHTTTGWLVLDVDFAILDGAGKVRGTNVLPALAAAAP